MDLGANAILILRSRQVKRNPGFTHVCVDESIALPYDFAPMIGVGLQFPAHIVHSHGYVAFGMADP